MNLPHPHAPVSHGPVLTPRVNVPGWQPISPSNVIVHAFTRAQAAPLPAGATPAGMSWQEVTVGGVTYGRAQGSSYFQKITYQQAGVQTPHVGVGRGGGGGGGGHGGGGHGGWGGHGGGGGFHGGLPGGGYGNRYGWGWNGDVWGWGYWNTNGGDVYLYPVSTACAAWSAPLLPSQITVALAQAARASLAAGVTQASDGTTLFSFSYAPLAPLPAGNTIVGAQQIIIRTCTQTGVGIGVGSFADVNPRCTSNAWFTGCYRGDYWTGYGSEDSEQRTYNANWVWNILQVGPMGEMGMLSAPPQGLNGCGGGCGRPGCPGGGGCKGCSCGCDRCRHYAWTSEMRATMDAQGLGHHPACPSVGLGHVEVTDVPDTVDVVIVQRGPVKQSPCDTRWQQADYPPTEGPTDADTRAAGCWWVQQVVPTQGVGSMQGISYGGRPIQGFGMITAPAPQPHGFEPLVRRIGVAAPILQRTGLAAPPAQGVGAVVTPTTSPASVGLAAALGAVVGSVAGAALGAEVGTGYGYAAYRRAGVGGLIGLMVGSFAGAAIAAPSVATQQGA